MELDEVEFRLDVVSTADALCVILVVGEVHAVLVVPCVVECLSVFIYLDSCHCSCLLLQRLVVHFANAVSLQRYIIFL